MNTRWILLISLLLLALGSCDGSSQAAVKQSPYVAPLDSPSQEPISGPSKSDPSLPQLPAPAVGSVVITNTTATPISSANSASALTPGPILQSLAQLARQDLANRLNVSLDKIDLMKVVPARWPYDSVGCPLPNVESIDTNTPGYQILLNANDQVYMYHTDGKDWIGLCTVKPPNEIQTLP
jgi:hypothetical protein